jgi:hypothetical protein
MCTVTVLTLPGIDGRRVRVASNRDERLDRPAALPPQIRTFGEHRAIMPVDPISDGTWIAASNAGLIVTLLNLNLPGRRALSSLASRGKIIPSLLHCDSTDQILAIANDIPAAAFDPFRVVAIDRQAIVQIFSDGRSLKFYRDEIHNRPRMFTSSSLGDCVVEPLRRELFDSFCRDGFTPEKQDAFHHHRWPDRGHLSVNMSRRDARTVSRTIAELHHDSVSLHYASDQHDIQCNLKSMQLQPA